MGNLVFFFIYFPWNFQSKNVVQSNFSVSVHSSFRRTICSSCSSLTLVTLFVWDPHSRLPNHTSRARAFERTMDAPCFWHSIAFHGRLSFPSRCLGHYSFCSHRSFFHFPFLFSKRTNKDIPWLWFSKESGSVQSSSAALLFGWRLQVSQNKEQSTVQSLLVVVRVLCMY